MGNEYATISAKRFDRRPWAGAARTHCIVFRNGNNKAWKEAKSLYFFVGGVYGNVSGLKVDK